MGGQEIGVTLCVVTLPGRNLSLFALFLVSDPVPQPLFLEVVVTPTLMSKIYILAVLLEISAASASIGAISSIAPSRHFG
jgi:hypothetical protein